MMIGDSRSHRRITNRAWHALACKYRRRANSSDTTMVLLQCRTVPVLMMLDWGKYKSSWLHKAVVDTMLSAPRVMNMLSKGSGRRLDWK